MNVVEGHYLDSGTAYDAGARHNGAVALLYVLNTGNKERKARQERIEKGDYREDDLEPKAI
jgi:hypothetical protein